MRGSIEHDPRRPVARDTAATAHAACAATLRFLDSTQKKNKNSFEIQTRNATLIIQFCNYSLCNSSNFFDNQMTDLNRLLKLKCILRADCYGPKNPQYIGLGEIGGRMQVKYEDNIFEIS